MLFSFLALTQPANSQDARAQGLAFHKLSMSGCQLGVGGLLQTQAAVIGHWMDQAQKAKDPTIFFLSVPDWLWCPDILRTTRGLHVLQAKVMLSVRLVWFPFFPRGPCLQEVSRACDRVIFGHSECRGGREEIQFTWHLHQAFGGSATLHRMPEGDATRAFGEFRFG